jgi:hypothetical protein
MDAMVFPLVACLFAAGGLGVVADAPAPDCPSAVEVAEAVGRRMPVSPVEGDAWSLHYGWDASSPTAAVSFRLMTPTGARALERRFPLLERECLAAAATMAVIVERYFRELGWTGGAPLPHVKVPERERPRAPPTVPPPSERLRLSLGAALRVAGSADVAATVGARVRALGPVYFGLAISVPPPRDSQALSQGGRVEADDWQSRLSSWAVGEKGPLEWGGGVELLAGLQAAGSSGITEPAHRRRALLALGVGGGPCYHLGPKWRVALELGAARRLPATTFTVTEDGVDHEVLAPSPWTFLAGLSLGYALLD